MGKCNKSIIQLYHSLFFAPFNNARAQALLLVLFNDFQIADFKADNFQYVYNYAIFRAMPLLFPGNGGSNDQLQGLIPDW